MADIEKSSRHTSIIGRFGELIICNWLSRSGFEVSVVDHTGIDIVAYHPRTGKRLGITVKSRTRNAGKENTYVRIFKSRDDREKTLSACNSFACEPWIAVYVETKDNADLFLTSLNNYDSKYGRNDGKIDGWKMTKRNKMIYEQDNNIRHIHINFEAIKWSW